MIHQYIFLKFMFGINKCYLVSKVEEKKKEKEKKGIKKKKLS